jgi:SAM-dependent methyltransferase
MSYLEVHPDADAEIARLAAQAEHLAAEERRALLQVGFPAEGRVLDLGCGPGAVAARNGRLFPGLSVVGAELDPRLASEARRTALPTVRARGEALPFAAATFDAAYTRLVLRHVSAPERVLAELVRVVRPGGSVVAIDTDDATLLLDPVPAGFAAALRAVHAAARARGADPHIGRRLPALLRAAGARDVRVAALTVTTDVLSPRAFAALVVPLVTAAPAERLSPEDAARAREGLLRWGERADVFASWTLFTVGGRRTAVPAS